jgi:hypothetical protein
MTLQIVNGPVIEAGESLSDGVDCSAGDIVRITTPSTPWTGGNMTFQISTDGQGYNDLYTAKGEEVTLVMPKTPSVAVIVRNEDWTKAINFLKIRAGSGSHPVVQEQRQQFAIAVEVPNGVAAAAASGQKRK